MKKRTSPKTKKARAAAKPARRPARAAAKPQKAKSTKSKKKSVAKPARTAAVRPKAPPPAPARVRAPVREFNGKLPSEAELRRMADAAYMNEAQLEFFRQRLLQMRTEVVNREVDVKERLHQRESFADPADRATAEEEHWLDLRLRERESYLLRKIDESLQRIRDREYGYCEVTGEPIGIPRLLARPTATVCVDVKGQNEQIESQFRDR